MSLNPTEAITTSNINQQDYEPITLREDNQPRYLYLPKFPRELETVVRSSIKENLLLANVPNCLLSPKELKLRQEAIYIPDPSIVNDIDDFVQAFNLSYRDAKELSIRLQVTEPILMFNANQLRIAIFQIISAKEMFRENVLFRKDYVIKDCIFNSARMSLALEFFLQMDVDTFYMKTCRFRGAKPSPSTPGLFCNDEQPQARYRMIPCGNENCLCCQTMTNNNQNSSWSIIDFANSPHHRFNNGYTTYLNCPATCKTSNIVYVMTCVCGKYEFIDSTSKTLADALAYHRLACNQTLHSILTGTSIYYLLMTRSERSQHQIMKEMRHYQHLAHCPAALQLFLERNPNYWCFISMSEEELLVEDTIYRQTVRSNTPANRPLISSIPATFTHQHRKVSELLQFLPLAPAGRYFSALQLQQQRLFFDRYLSTPIDEPPFVETDMYQMKIIAVLPLDESIKLRYFIETLLIIHAETKLNMVCLVNIDPKKCYGLPYDRKWYNDLKRPPPSSQELILSVIEKIKEFQERPEDIEDD